MVDNTGNSYRTRQAVIACLSLIAIAVAVLLYGVYEVDALTVVGALILMFGIIVAIMSLSFSSVPDKFGPSEMVFRLAAGLFMAVVGAVLIMIGQDVSIYVSIAVLIIGIAVIGLCATLIGNKTSKY